MNRDSVKDLKSSVDLLLVDEYNHRYEILKVEIFCIPPHWCWQEMACIAKYSVWLTYALSKLSCAPAHVPIEFLCMLRAATLNVFSVIIQLSRKSYFRLSFVYSNSFYRAQCIMRVKAI